MPKGEYPSKRTYRVHRVRRSVRALVGMKDQNTTFARKKDQYFAHVWINAQLWGAICFLARVNRSTKMATVRQLLEAGISTVLTKAVLENTQMREQGMPATPLIRGLVKWARSEGYR